MMENELAISSAFYIIYVNSHLKWFSSQSHWAYCYNYFHKVTYNEHHNLFSINTVQCYQFFDNLISTCIAQCWLLLCLLLPGQQRPTQKHQFLWKKKQTEHSTHQRYTYMNVYTGFIQHWKALDKSLLNKALKSPWISK